MAGSYSLCSGLRHSTVQNGNLGAESTIISDADATGNKTIPFSQVLRRKDKELDSKTYTHVIYIHMRIYGWEIGTGRGPLQHFTTQYRFRCTGASPVMLRIGNVFFSKKKKKKKAGIEQG